MKLFRFCRQGLTALPVFFMLMACDKLLPTSGSGDLVPVKIRSVSVKGYGEASATRSAGGEKRIVGEPVVQDLGGGMLAEITVEEDVEALRADPQRLAGGKKFRVIAIDATTKKLYSYADYTVPSAAPQNGEISPDAGELHVLGDNDHSYDFICISYNTETLPPDGDYKEGEELPLLSASISQEILYWRGAKENDFSLNIVLRPQFVKVKLKLDAGENKTITAVADNSISLNAASSGNFNLAKGEFTSSGNTVFTWPETINDETVTSDEITFIPQAKYTFSFAAEAISWEDNATTGKTTEGPIGSFQFKFDAGSSYTVTLTILRLPKFAGSNIYWDGTQLTFDPYGINNDHAKYQGVYFKWGSLIGVAAGATDESYSAGSTVLYKPTNTSDPVGTARTWIITTGTSSDHPTWSDWAAIPYQNANMSTDETLFSKGNAGFTSYKGDICYYINKDYRMPTGAELDSLKSYHKSFTKGDITVSKADGTYEVSTQYTTLAGIVFPASGYRYVSSGTLTNVGYNGYYWSGSALSGTNGACELYFSSSGDANTLNADRSNGHPVRCVKN